LSKKLKGARNSTTAGLRWILYPLDQGLG